MKYFNRRKSTQTASIDSSRGLLGNTTVKVVAGVGAFSIFALAAGAGQGFMAPVVAAPQTAQAAQALAKQATTTTTGTSNPLDVVVGNALTITADAKGEISSNGFAVATNVSGQGDTQVGIPVGPSRMVNVNNFSRLNVQNGTIQMPISNSGDQVQNLLATGGQFQGKMPVAISTKITVDGKEIDPNTATSVTGNVIAEWTFTNKTMTQELVSYANAQGQMVTEQVPVGVPFTVALKGTFGNGWTNIVAPWANSGFSAGQEITGGGSLGSEKLVLSMSALADKGLLPEMSGSFVPTSANGSITTGLGKVATGGQKLEGILDGKAVPMLLEVQNGLGKASGEIATLLDKKVNPILNLLSKLKLDPRGVDKLLDTAGADLSKASGVLLGANATVDQGAAQVAGALADITSPSSQAALTAMIASLDDVDGKLASAISAMKTVSDALPEVVDALGTQVPTAVGLLLCPKGTGNNCTVGQILQADLTGRLSGTCSTSAAVNTAYNSGVQASLTTAIGNTSGNTKTQLTQLQTLLDAQLAASGAWASVSQCQTDAATITTGTDTLFSDLGTIGTDIAELLPLLTTLDKGLDDASTALKNLDNKLPAINRALDKPCSPQTMANISNCGLIQALEISANADAAASKQLDKSIIALVNGLKIPINELFGIANALGRSAKPLEAQINGLPGVINDLAYGPLGYFVNGVEDLAGLASSLTDGASKIAATNKLIDEKFVAGEGFPYNAPATGEGTVTAATYSYTLAAATTTSVSSAAVIGFALLLLVAAIGAAVWMSRRTTT